MIICADDYGMREDIDESILELARTRRLSAVSCMAVLNRCRPEGLRPLLELAGSVDVGLHLCLADECLRTEAMPRTATPGSPLPAYKRFAAAAILGKVSETEALRWVMKQYEIFVQKCGRPPDFIDGHLYVQQLPGVRKAVVHFVKSLGPECRPYVRNTRMRLDDLLREDLPVIKAAPIAYFGSRMQRLLQSEGLRTNRGLAGIYSFGRYRRYGSYLPRFLALLIAPNGLLVVHPGKDEAWRRAEFEALREYDFKAELPNRFIPE